MSKYEKAYLYFDTNFLECRHSGKSLYLSQFTVNPSYYEIEDMIFNMGLTDKVELCIPDVVWLELQEHLIKHFKSEKSSMESKINAFRKSFGNLAEIYCEFKDCVDDSDYKNYVSEIAQDFLDNPRVNSKIIPCPKDENSMKMIIDQAIHSIRPFRVAKAGSKEYSDAGFKDALIFHTILTHTNKQLGILISNDNDFSELFNGEYASNLKMCNNVKDVRNILSQEFNITIDDMVETLLHTDDYLIQRILSECEFDKNTHMDSLSIKSCKSNEDNAEVSFKALINGIQYSFDIEYNLNAKELLNASCEIIDETEAD